MPGAPFMHELPGFQGGVQEVRMAQSYQGSGVVTHTGFIVWLVVIGLVIPAAILGGLRLGGFSFVFKHR